MANKPFTANKPFIGYGSAAESRADRAGGSVTTRQHSVSLL